MNLYASLFPGSEIGPIDRYGPDEGGDEGAVKRASFRIGGHDLVFNDSPVTHDFTFTPSISLFVECDSEAELNTAFASLEEGGQVLMPLGDYGFSTRFGWLSDRFGVSWQLNLQ